MNLSVQGQEHFVQSISRHFADISAEQSIMSQMNWSLAASPAFKLAILLMKKAGMSEQTYLMLFALFDIGVGLWFIRKYTNNTLLAVFYFYVIDLYTFYMAAIVQCTALACCLIGVDRLLSNRQLGFWLWLLIGIMFHPYCVIYAVAPIMTKAPWTKVTYLALFSVALGIVFFRPILEAIISITTAMGEDYTVEEFSQGGVNGFRVAVCLMPTVISFATRRFLINNTDKKENLLINLAILNGLLMVIALFGTANYFARMAHYFLIFQVFALPLLFRYFNPQSKLVLVIGSIVGYLIYFYYANGILSGGFDTLYKRITLLEYLSSLFSG